MTDLVGPRSLAHTTVRDFDELVRSEYRRLVALGTALTGRWDVGEELAQEALLAAHKSWHRVSRYDDPGGFCRRVVANRAFSWQRRRRSQEATIQRIVARPAMREGPEATSDTDVWAAVRSLPRRQAQIVGLHYVADLTVDEAARVLGISPGSAKKYLYRAREALRDMLGEPS
jgi:RNA polymerase sigma-70 factor, ECF subfamily